MTGEEIAVKLEDHEHEIGSLKHRMEKAEKVIDSIHELSTNVSVLVTTVKNTDEKVTKLDNKITIIEQEPADSWKKLKTVIVTAIVSGLVGTLLGALIKLM